MIRFEILESHPVRQNGLTPEACLISAGIKLDPDLTKMKECLHFLIHILLYKFASMIRIVCYLVQGNCLYFKLHPLHLEGLRLMEVTGSLIRKCNRLCRETRQSVDRLWA